MTESILVGVAGETPVELLLKRANRHGLVAGATGTGKTVTLQVLAESFANAGVPVFAADVKGDLSGIAMPGEATGRFADRAKQLGIADYAPKAAPVVLWDLYGEKGHPIRTTAESMGPVLLARMLELTDPQEGALAIAFKLAADENLPLLDLKDLQSLITHVNDRREELSGKYGLVAPQSIAAIQRRLLQLETEGATSFFGEPALELADFLKTAPDGRGYVNLLAADRLMQAPRLYATFLLWLLSTLFEELPEIGDPEKPKLVFFFDEAHLLFSDSSPALLQRIEQVVRLIRSKGVGVYFVTQNPRDVPDTVLAQLGNKVQHALRAFTPAERKSIRAAADSFRPNPAFKTEDAITELGIGEALLSFLDAKGTPEPVQRALIAPPKSRVGPASDAERAQIMKQSPIGAAYNKTLDRESAHEILAKQRKKVEAEEAKAARDANPLRNGRSTATKSTGRHRETVVEKSVKRAAGAAGTTLARELVKVLVNVFLGKKR